MTAFTTRPEILGTFGVVTSTHWIASAVGMSILEKGGNAFDAAVATGFVLQIVEPHLCGPGGDMPAVIYSKKKDKVEVICAQGPAPAGATIEHYTSEGLSLIPGDGLLATVIPGSFDGWMLMLRDYGKLTVRDVLEPAIYYAEHGHPMLPRVSGDHCRPRRILSQGMADARTRPGCPVAPLPNPGRTSRTRSLPKPGSALSRKRKARAAARRRSKQPATPIIAASLPRRSIPTCARPRSWMRAGNATRAC